MAGFKANNEDVNLKELVNEIVLSFETTLSQKYLKIESIVGEDHLCIDREMLKMILRNFINNAVKFSNKGDTIVVKCFTEDESISLAVLDQGIGMSHDQIKKLFSLKINQTNGTQNEKGSGIGLIMTKDFIEMLGGKIAVNSVEGKGSEFKVTFPLSQAVTAVRVNA